MHQRIDKLRKRIEELKLDAFLVTSLVNIRYLFGFTGSNAIALITSDLSFFVTDRRYVTQSQQEVQQAEILIAQRDLIGELKKTNVPLLRGKLGFEALNLTVKNYTEIKKAFPDTKLIAAERVVESIASVKDSSEIENVRAGGRICGKVIAEIIEVIQPGVSELDISAELSYRTRLHGSERDPFEPIVASGLRSALPHGISSPQKLQNGDLIIIDFGAVVNGYASDVTRTMVLGQPSQKQTEMLNVVLGALTTAEQSCKPGMTGKALDRVARDYLKEAGYGEFFQHSLGHGLGLEIHGLPRIGELSNDTLQAGNIITLEPGVYVPDVGGVRVEDDFALTSDGSENLTPFPRELIRVGRG
ncbi:Xaa-Pro peptidase family protein [bacterium]|nr:Xaa-Pro peptidase family protein [bacterium]